MNYRAVIELYSVDASSGQVLREGDATVIIEADTHEKARVKLREETRQFLLKKRQTNIRFKSCLYSGADLVHELQGIGVGSLSPESESVAEAFFKYKEEHPEPVPEDQMTPLQKRMQSGDM